MIVFDNIDNISPKKNRIITLGSFDGVHLGHQEIIRFMKERASKNNLDVTVVSFEPHPRKVLNPNYVFEELTTYEEKRFLFEKFGVDSFVVLKFDEKMAQLDSNEFLTKVLYEKIGFDEIVVGFDHRFGKGRDGGEETIRSFCAANKLECFKIQPVVLDEEKVSSSRIRELVKSGDVSRGNILLNHNYTMQGKVIHGVSRGTQLGFPTANLEIKSNSKLLPSKGVYAVTAEVNGVEYAGVLNSGLRPTFDNSKVVFHEVHIFNFSRDIYGEELKIQIIEKLRNELKFASVDDLISQINKDIKQAKSVIENRKRFSIFKD